MNQQVPRRSYRQIAWHRVYALIALILTFPICSVYAKPLLEKTETFEIDWASMRIRFWGEAVAGSQSESLAEIEKRALDSGLLGVRDSFAQYFVLLHDSGPLESGLLLERGMRVGVRLTKATYAYRNEYFGDGAVRVYMVSSLSRAMLADHLVFSESEEAQTEVGQEFTGLVLNLPEQAKPAAMFTVKDEFGEILYELRNVSRKAFERRGMGQWFVRPTQQELVRSVGKKSKELNLKSGQNRLEFLTKRNEWNEIISSSSDLLLGAKIALVLPTQKA